MKQARYTLGSRKTRQAGEYVIIPENNHLFNPRENPGVHTDHNNFTLVGKHRRKGICRRVAVANLCSRAVATAERNNSRREASQS